jgi:geranylgeranyl diphosphate synthase type II
MLQPREDVYAPLPRIEQTLDMLSQQPRSPRGLEEAVRYSLLSGGKRLRPILAWHACVAAGGDGADSLHAGAAVEFIHCFSLVHDDLPAIDNDDLRRGRPTLHKHAGEAMAILAGDALTLAAFEVLVDAKPAHLPRLELIRELSHATSAMIHGQVWDTLGGLPAGLQPLEQLKLIHRNKTGALIRASCRMGAMCARPGPNFEASLAAITRYADDIGLMFQVVDDLLDVTQSAEHTGKRTGKDIDAGKLTFPGVMGVEKTREHVHALKRDALAAIEPLGERGGQLAELCELMSTRTK